MYSKVKRFYDLGLYSDAQVAQFVVKGKLTAEEYQQITGQTYTVASQS